MGSLRRQIIILVAVVLLGVVIAGGYSCVTMVRFSQASYDEWCSANIAQFEDVFLQKRYKIQSILMACGYNENVQRLLNGMEESPYEVLTPIYDLERNLILLIYNYTKLDESLMDAYVSGKNNLLYSYIRYLEEEELYQFLAACSGQKEGMISDIFELGTRKCFAVSEPIWKISETGNEYPLTEENRIGTAVFTVNTDFLVRELEKISSEKITAFLTDRNGDIILETKKPEEISENIRKALKKQPGEKNAILQTDGFTLSIKEISDNGWSLVVMAPRNYRNFYNVGSFVWLAVWPGILFLIFLFAYPILKELNRFVKEMVSHMEKIGNGELETKLVPMNKREFYQIADGLNVMMDRLNELMKKNIHLSTRLYREQAEKTNAMLLALQSQMNPHFLYNTIECIKNIGICYDVKEIEQLSTALSGILRYSLRGENIVRVSEEMECIQNFITIQTIRFENKYNVTYEIDESCLTRPILRLSLQPLVENAMKHGLEMKRSDAKLWIRIFQDEKYLFLQAEDNGIGMEPEKAEEILSGNKQAGSVAIGNLVNRLKLFYGEAAVLSIDSFPGKGTCATIRIEKKSMETEEKSMVK